jgi:hypothetical protein
MNTNEAIQQWPEHFQSQATWWAAVYKLQVEVWKDGINDGCNPD